ncbi:MAG TPA: cobalamin-binding domain-containing protein, partial [Candidatus Tripitaka californicus]
IDKLSPDYEIIDHVKNANFSYENTDAYLGYTTRGCVWKCEFCAVKEFEPKYIPHIDIRSMIKEIDSKFGEKQNLLLMDNNVLASPQFDQIINDIKEAGFVKGATFGKTRRKRMVDFNQGLDARLFTEAKMKRLSEIPLEPMRIAFDDIQYKETYVKAVRLAHKYGQKNMSNYILYNFKDTPEDFYERLKINIELNKEFARDKHGVRTNIYSFPMRYIPLDAKDRDIDTGNRNWNKRYLRGVKIILNVTKGPVMPGAEFFYQAFGNDAEEFKAILLMPEDFIRNRVVLNWRKVKGIKRLKPYVRNWMDIYFDLSQDERSKLIEILSSNGMSTVQEEINNSDSKKIKKLLGYHLNAIEEVAKYKNA